MSSIVNLTEDFDVIGHVPKLMSTWLTKFLKRLSNSGKVIIKGKRVNRGSGYGLELPCEYHFQGDNSRIRSPVLIRRLTSD